MKKLGFLIDVVSQTIWCKWNPPGFRLLQMFYHGIPALKLFSWPQKMLSAGRKVLLASCRVGEPYSKNSLSVTDILLYYILRLDFLLNE